MRKIIFTLIITVPLAVLLFVPGISNSMNIIPNYDANITPQQKTILDAKIALWEARLCSSIVVTIDFLNEDLGASKVGTFDFPLGVEFAVGTFPKGEWITWGVADSFKVRADGTPRSARIRFNNNAAADWHYGGEPVPAGKIDFWTVANHEIVHAIGFTVNYTRFAAQVTPGPGDNRTYSCNSTLAVLGPSDDGTHLEPTFHPNHLMNAILNTGERRTPSQLEIDMLRCPWEYATDIEMVSFTADAYDTHVKIIWITANEIDNAGFNIHRSFERESPLTQLNFGLITARGDEIQGAEYSFIDEDVTGGISYCYWLESVDLKGNSIINGPLHVSAGSTEKNSEIPGVFRLTQNYPNPFNPSTEIGYDLPVACHVKLEVYNVLGQKVKTLVNAHQGAGSEVTKWNGTNEKGLPVSGGIYFYRLEAGDFFDIKKMVLIK